MDWYKEGYNVDESDFKTRNKAKNKTIMQLEGTIKLIGVTQQVSDSFKKRDMVLTTNDQYPQQVLIQFVQDQCTLLNQYKAGEQVAVNINIRGREWVNPKGGEIKYFNTIQGWKIGYAGQHADAIEGAKHEAETWNPNQEDDGLPY